jgi:hypothetical protein
MKGRLTIAVCVVCAFAPVPIGIAGLNHIVVLPIWFVACFICSIAAASGLTRRIENPSTRSLIGFFLCGFFLVFNFAVVAHLGLSRIEGLVL